MLIPNKQVFENAIQNYTTTGRRRIDLRVGVAYDADLEKVRRVAIRALEQVSTRKADTEVEAFFEEFGDSAITLVARFWIDFTSQQADYLQARSEAIERLKSAFDQNGITIRSPLARSTSARGAARSCRKSWTRSACGGPGTAAHGRPTSLSSLTAAVTSPASRVQSLEGDMS